MDDLKPRVAKLEWQVEAHSDQLHNLNNVTAELKQELCAINRSLLQIKWLGLGVALTIFSESFGLGSIFKIFGM